MKKTLAIFATTMLAALLLTACGGRTLNANEQGLVGIWDMYGMTFIMDGEEYEVTLEDMPELKEFGYYIEFTDKGTVEMEMEGTAKGKFSMDDNGTITFGRGNDTYTAYLQNGLLVIDDEALKEELVKELGIEATLSFEKR